MNAETTQPPAAPPKQTRKERCETCKFCEDNRCKRFPPVIFRYNTDREYPMVKTQDWCGEWKALTATVKKKAE